MDTDRVVVWFSCGAASAVAAKLAVTKYADRCVVVYCNTLASEHPDNARFMRDVETWLGQSVTIIGSAKYASIDEVFEKRRYMSGIAGAICTVEMKKIPRFDFQRADDLHIFGLTSDEGRRIKQFEANNPELFMEWNLRDAGISKTDCYALIEDAGIKLPALYALGFRNNNCIGCVKATSAVYWHRVRTHFPAIFNKRAEQSRAIGARLVFYQGKRIFLDELPLHPIVRGKEPDIECGPVCIQEG